MVGVSCPTQGKTEAMTSIPSFIVTDCTADTDNTPESHPDSGYGIDNTEEVATTQPPRHGQVPIEDMAFVWSPASSCSPPLRRRNKRFQRRSFSSDYHAYTRKGRHFDAVMSRIIPNGGKFRMSLSTRPGALRRGHGFRTVAKTASANPEIENADRVTALRRLLKAKL